MACPACMPLYDDASTDDTSGTDQVFQAPDPVDTSGASSSSDGADWMKGFKMADLVKMASMFGTTLQQIMAQLGIKPPGAKVPPDHPDHPVQVAEKQGSDNMYVLILILLVGYYLYQQSEM